MKYILLSVIAIWAMKNLPAQNGAYWSIRHNNKTLKTFSSENESKNIVAVKKSQFNKPGVFSFTYTQNGPDTDWIRTLMIFDSTGNNPLWKKDSTSSFQLSNEEMKKIIIPGTQIKIYMVALPADPPKAAVARVRRILLCTVKLK